LACDDDFQSLLSPSLSSTVPYAINIIRGCGPTPQPIKIRKLTHEKNGTTAKTLVALLMSLALPGFGQLYNGELNRAIWFYLSYCALVYLRWR
jgi:hypothetical protein